MLDEFEQADTLVLEEFVPFRLNRLADVLSRRLSEIYRERFGLEIPEWRVLVTVGEREACTAKHIARSTRMHKTRVSRAIAALEARKMVARSSSAADGRELPLCLSAAGRRLYAALVPLALQRERELMASLSASQYRAFRDALRALELSLGLSGHE